MDRVFLNNKADDFTGGLSPGKTPARFHRKLPGYRSSPLVNCAGTAKAIGAAGVFVKDESSRLGLPAFKILGASWAVYNLVKGRYGLSDGDWKDVAELKELLRGKKRPVLVTATDGNHGRAVARTASWFGFGSLVFVPEQTVRARIEAIESEGARVVAVPGDYEDAVKEARSREDEGYWLIQDTAWPGYTDIPALIVEGYSTIFHEIDDEVKRGEAEPCDIFVVQIGVGSLAAAAVSHLKAAGRVKRPFIIAVEPENAACAFESVKAGERLKVEGPQDSIMAGLNCPLLSSEAWPLIRGGVDAFVKVSDEAAIEAMKILASAGIESGESGAAAVAGLLEITGGAGGRSIGKALGLKEGLFVTAVSTEGITDPDASYL